MPPSRLSPPTAEERRVVLTVGLGESLVQFGLSPVTAVIPGLAVAVGVGAADGAWILTVFILALAGALLVSGRLGDLIGHRRVFAAGAALYAVSSVGAALAGGFVALLVARAGQGLGAAMVSGNNLAILAGAVAEARRGRAIALVATASSVAAVVGAGLAGPAVSAGLWRLLFLGVAPLAVWAAFRAARLPGSTPDLRRVAVDWGGAALLLVTATLVAVVLSHPHSRTDAATMPVFHAWLPALAVVSGIGFALVERRAAVPLLDWRQLRNALFAAAIGVNVVLHMTMMAAMFLGPLLVVDGLGMSATAGSLLMVVIQASVTLTAFLGGWLHDRTHSPWIRPLAAATLGVAFVAWALAGLRGSHAGLLAAGSVGGLGLGVLLAVNNTVIMGALPAALHGVAAGMLETTRHFAHAFGVTIPTAVLGAVAAATVAEQGGAAVLRHAFFWSCLAMAGVAVAGVLLALVSPRRRAAPGAGPVAGRLAAGVEP